MISVIVATYQRPDALDAVLRGLAGQGDRDFEVIVADDGSGPETRAVVDAWKPRIGVPLTHVWHPDEGFRLAEIRNRAVLAARGEVCIFLDGDCIPRPTFIAAHRQLAEPGWFVAGNRVLLSEALTARVLSEGLTPESWSLPRMLRARFAGEINRVVPLLSLPLGSLRGLKAERWEGARGANLAIRREDLVKVDGFDASFAGWGLEDSDCIIRLIRAGVRRKDGRWATGVLHLWHKENDRSRLPENRRRLEAVIAASGVKAERGLSALSAVPA